MRRARIALYACTLAVYAGSLTGPFQFDDTGVIVHYAPVHSLAACFAVLGHGLRPLLKLSYALSWSLGWGAFGFHLGNVALHVLNVELVMRVCAAARDREQRWPFVANDVGTLGAGCLFALHPIHTEVVTYISGRSSSLSTAFALFALLFYVDGVRARRVSWWLGLAGGAYVAAVLSKEALAALPLSFLLWELCIERRPLRELGTRMGVYALLLVALSVAAVMHGSYFALLYSMTGTRPLLASLQYQVAGSGYLLSRLVLLGRLSIDPGLGFHAPERTLLIASSAAIGVLVALALLQLRKRPVLSFGLAWFVVHAFVPYVLLPRVDVVNERHAYLADAGLFVAFGALLAELAMRLPDRRNVQRIMLGIALLVCGALVGFTVRRNRDYASARTLWESTVHASPANPRAHNNLGMVYEGLGELDAARTEYARAVALEPRYQSAAQRLSRLVNRVNQADPNTNH